MKKLKPKVTVASVKRQWETKYAALNKQYDLLAVKHIEMAKHADEHRNAQQALERLVDDYRSLATERLVRIQRLLGVIAYLDGEDLENV